MASLLPILLKHTSVKKINDLNSLLTTIRLLHDQSNYKETDDKEKIANLLKLFPELSEYRDLIIQLFQIDTDDESDIFDFAGAWANIPQDEIEALKTAIGRNDKN